jgi:hypothetical protein
MRAMQGYKHLKETCGVNVAVKTFHGVHHEMPDEMIDVLTKFVKARLYDDDAKPAVKNTKAAEELKKVSFCSCVCSRAHRVRE